MLSVISYLAFNMDISGMLRFYIILGFYPLFSMMKCKQACVKIYREKQIKLISENEKWSTVHPGI